MNAWLSFVQIWLFDFAFLATALLAAAMLLRLILRDASSRVLLAWGTWLGIAAAALVTLAPGWPRYEWSAIARSLSGEANVDIENTWTVLPPVIVDWTVAADPMTTAVPVGDDSLVEPLRLNGHDLAVLGWIGGAILGLAWIALGCWQARRLLKHSHAAPNWIYAEFNQLTAPRMPRADVRTSAALASAVALRARKPAILLPRTSADPSYTKAVRAALAHEWAHIRNGDLWLLALERLLLPLLALHPLFWWLRRSTRLDQELLADAAAAGDKPVEYAEALVAWAKTSAPPPAALAALAFWDRPTNLTRRVHMILHHPRPAVTWFSRLLSFAAFACLLALVGGLSLFTLRPLAADDEPAQPSAASRRPLADHPPMPPAPPDTKASIELQFKIIEADRLQLAEVLPVVGPQPDPETNISFHSPESWLEVLTQLTSHKETLVISNPRLITQSGQEAVIQIGAVAERDERESGATNSELKETKLSISAVPVLVMNNGKHHVQLRLDAAVGELPVIIDAAAPEQPVLAAAPRSKGRRREFRVEVNVPLGKTVAIGHRSLDNSKRALVVAVEPKLVATWQEVGADDTARKATPVQESLAQRFEETRQLLSRLQADDPQSRREAAALRHTLLRLQREIAALLDQTAEGAKEADPVVIAQKRPLSKAAATPSKNIRVFKVKPDKANEQAEKLMRKLTEFGFADNARVSPDEQTGAIIVQADGHAMNFAIEFLAALSDESQPAAPKVTATVTRSSSADRPSLEQKLLELDLREAEIGLQAAKAEHEQMAEVRSKNPAALSNAELRHSQLKVELAQVQVERMKVRIEAARAANPPATPAASRR